MDWSDIARKTVAEVAATIPESATLKERKKALYDAYPFGERAYWPYKAWCKAQRDYLKHWTHPQTAEPLFANFARDPVTGRPIIP